MSAVRERAALGTHFGAATEHAHPRCPPRRPRSRAHGLGRHHGSGEIFLAFSTTARAPRRDPSPPSLADTRLDALFQATVEATEEAVINALWRAETTNGRDGRVVERLPHERALELLAAHGRLGG